MEVVEGHQVCVFPPVRRRGMYALAQHYGIPTRLLDWTWKPLVAAYFPAVDVARRLCQQQPAPSGSDGRLAVWAVQHRFIDEVCRYWNPGAVIVTVPTTSNPNLHAQEGLFTLVCFRRQPSPDRDIPPLDELLADPKNARAAEAHRQEAHDQRREGFLPLPMLYKFTLPQEQARRLLHFLDLHEVNASTVYPGHQSIVEYMREAKYRTVARPSTPG